MSSYTFAVYTQAGFRSRNYYDLRHLEAENRVQALGEVMKDYAGADGYQIAVAGDNGEELMAIGDFVIELIGKNGRCVHAMRSDESGLISTCERCGEEQA